MGIGTSLAGSLAGLVPPRRNPHAVVEIGGRRYDSWTDKQMVKDVMVELATDQASEATLTVFDPRFVEIDRFTSEGGVTRALCLFWLGFGRDLGPPAFKGLLSEVERNDTDTTFRVRDMSEKMKQERKGEYFRGTDVEIIRKLATRNGLAFVGPDGPVKPPLEDSAMIEDEKNDWEFAQERARDSGFIIYVRHDTLFLKEPAKLGAPKLTMRYRKDFVMLHGFDLTYKLPENPIARPKEVETRGRLPGGKRLTGKSNLHPRGTRPIEFTRDLSRHTKTHARRRAQAKKELQRDPAFECTVEAVPVLPRERPDARDTVRLMGVGKLFSGRYLIDKVRHRLSGREFKTEYTLYRDIDA